MDQLKSKNVTEISEIYPEETRRISEVLDKLRVAHSNGYRKIYTAGAEYIIEIINDNHIRLYIYDKYVMTTDVEGIIEYFTLIMSPGIKNMTREG